jgi:ABC-type Fe3+-hydroxamate transport system substrate-binding protein
MDASSLKVAATAPIHVKDAAGEPLYEGDKPVRIIVHGPGSRAYGAVETRQTARALKRMNDNDGKVTAATAEERRQETAEDLASITVAFEHLTHGDKQGTELFEAVYGDPELGFIAKQVTKALADWGNFKPGSAGS